MLWLFGGILIALLVLFILNWWANTSVAKARKTAIWAMIVILFLLGGILLAAGKFIVALFPIILGVARFLSLKRQFTGYKDQFSNFRDKGTPGSEAISRREAFEILGLREGASREEIKEAYKKLIAKAHPDKGGSDWMAAKLNEARRVLLDE